jgi:cytochrome c peroxidase
MTRRRRERCLYRRLREKSGLTAPCGRGSLPALRRLTSRDHRERWVPNQRGPALLLCALLFAGAAPAGDFEWTLPQGFPRPAIPPDNPITVEKVELGRRLFYDRRMSSNGRESCGTCHRQELAFTDGRAHAEGTTGELHPRGSMSLINVAYNPVFTWANSALDSLEQQALIPMLGENPVELGLKGREQVFLDAVRRDPNYQKLFPRAFPSEADPFNLPDLVKAIATFERSIVSMRSPYDRYRYGHQENAISESAKRGEFLFDSSERARCFRCHAGWNFGGSVRYQGGPTTVRGSFFNTGVSAYAAPNRGLFEQTGRAQDIGKFRVPSLRNVAVTAPYMHDGSLATLEDVIEHYSAGGKFDHPNKSEILRPIGLTAQDKQDLVEFLKSLTDQEALHDVRWSDPWPAR